MIDRPAIEYTADDESAYCEVSLAHREARVDRWRVFFHLPMVATPEIVNTPGALDQPPNGQLTPSPASKGPRYVPATGKMHDAKLAAEVLRLRAEGMERVEIAAELKLADTYVGLIVRNALKRGEIQPLSRSGKKIERRKTGARV